ncbi:methyltransferase [Piscirickettsia litoralis]|uniref:O-methyltransferase domain-containing protein n=1 Tax=Piscirickettsia litoralis TaxID=1891921 RepID=A0ABX3A225_9GAMM|nr:methyltransferase [Piscirickettsia litoralis]ODN42498.1 hypothetical protein BGC07_05605 [Piscirickettsia litoralis]
MNKENFMGNNNPKEQMIDFTLVSLAGQLVGVAAKLGIADMLKDQPLNINELASKVEADTQSLYRLMRPLVALGVFGESSDHKYELTPMSQFLLSDHKDSLRYISMLNAGHMGWKPQGALFDSVKSGKTAFDTIFQSGLYTHLHDNPDDEALFGKAMDNLTNIDLNNIINNFNPSDVNTLVDIGSGEGGLIGGILEKNINIKGILADREEVLAVAKEKLTNRGLSERCQFIPTDFFKSVPSGGDVYLMRKVLHNWDDDKAVKILSNCRLQMHNKAKLLVIDVVVPTDDSGIREKLRDVEMMIYLSGKQRTEKDFKDLFDKAGFDMTDIVSTTGALSSIIEGRPRVTHS